MVDKCGHVASSCFVQESWLRLAIMRDSELRHLLRLRMFWPFATSYRLHSVGLAAVCNVGSCLALARVLCTQTGRCVIHYIPVISVLLLRCGDTCKVDAGDACLLAIDLECGLNAVQRQ